MTDTKKTIEVARQQVATAKNAVRRQRPAPSLNMAAFDSMTKGVEIFGNEIANFNHNSFEISIANNESLMACKRDNETLDLQSGFARTSFDSVITQSAKLTEVTLKTKNESLAPLQDQAKQVFLTAFSTTSI